MSFLKQLEIIMKVFKDNVSQKEKIRLREIWRKEIKKQ